MLPVGIDQVVEHAVQVGVELLGRHGALSVTCVDIMNCYGGEAPSLADHV